MHQRILKINNTDNVAVALQDLPAGASFEVDEQSIVLKSDVTAKHKFALTHISKGDAITMYGVKVGKALKTIQQGEVISLDNVIHDANKNFKRNGQYRWRQPDISRFEGRTFNGYYRKDGKVGTANYWLVIPLVFCENRNIEVLRSSLAEKLGYYSKEDHRFDIDPLIKAYRQGSSVDELQNIELQKAGEKPRSERIFPNIDGIKFLTHNTGCGGTRGDSKMLCELLAGYLTNPNVAGATILSLGCQNAQQKDLEEAITRRDKKFDKPIYFLEQQNSKSERSFLSEAINKTFTGLIEANQVTRQPAPVSKLVLGLECGGSDGFSGISANPALGYASDLLAALGGSPLLSEFPELNGVEQELLNRCVDDQIGEKFQQLMKAYAKRAEDAGSGFEANPSPGNIKDGLITDAMKSAGAAKKGGTSPVTDVLDYAEPVTKSGLNLLCTPGNDVESTTALAGSGANVIVFTTGLGTPTGNPVAPVIKLSSNTPLFNKMNDIIDVDTGGIISGEVTLQQKGEELLEFIIKVASGEVIPKAVQLGQDDFIPWKRDISL